MDSIVSAINGVWHWYRDPAHVQRSTSPTGHTIHYMEAGSYMLTLNGRTMRVSAGDLVYYGSLESHTWRADGTSTSFYSINFLPRDNTAPPDNQRLVTSDFSPAPWFATAEEAFREANDPVRQAQCFAALHQILAYTRRFFRTSQDTGDTALWRDLEKRILQKRTLRVSVGALAEASGYNVSTVYRSCRSVHGVSPVVRIRQMRMEEAVNLLRHTALPVRTVAAELGYSRVHEFSREFSLYYGCPPREFRNRVVEER